MKYEKTIRRSNGSRIKLIVTDGKLVEIQKAHKGKRFFRVAPIPFLTTGEFGERHNGFALMNKDKEFIMRNGEWIQSHEDLIGYGIDTYSSRDEVFSAITEWWESMKPKAETKVDNIIIKENE